MLRQQATNTEIRMKAMALTSNLIAKGGLQQQKVFDEFAYLRPDKILPVLLDIITDLQACVSKRPQSAGTLTFLTIAQKKLIEHGKVMDSSAVSFHNKQRNLSTDLAVIKDNIENISFFPNKDELFLWQELIMWLQILYLNAIQRLNNHHSFVVHHLAETLKQDYSFINVLALAIDKRVTVKPFAQIGKTAMLLFQASKQCVVPLPLEIFSLIIAHSVECNFDNKQLSDFANSHFNLLKQWLPAYLGRAISEPLPQPRL